ncbi:hypothetical protein I316_04868 [Kwoniella heveanensis BCC8398]|uniref:Uncharacterized protein n=1 Tax=Kwoniella heveanensis BCC8398 TaxID=1296120 RepID=A0A1B9GR48_9TREE|nr:hypothetical protein I316_04868 [Kwoniella heveanensis BCC8398]
MTEWDFAYTFIDPYGKKKIFHWDRTTKALSTTSVVQAFEDKKSRFSNELIQEFQRRPEYFALYVVSLPARNSGLPYWVQATWQEADILITDFLERVSVIDTDYSPHIINIEIAPKEVSDKRLLKARGADHSRRFTMSSKPETETKEITEDTPAPLPSNNQLQSQEDQGFLTHKDDLPEKFDTSGDHAKATSNSQPSPASWSAGDKPLGETSSRPSVACTAAAAIPMTAVDDMPAVVGGYYLLKIRHPLIQQQPFPQAFEMGSLPDTEELQLTTFGVLMSVEYLMTKATFLEAFEPKVGPQTYEAWRTEQMNIGSADATTIMATVPIRFELVVHKGLHPGKGLEPDVDILESTGTDHATPCIAPLSITTSPPYSSAFSDVKRQDKVIDRVVSSEGPVPSNKVLHPVRLCGHTAPRKECWRCHMDPTFSFRADLRAVTPTVRAIAASPPNDTAVTPTNNRPQSERSAEERRWAYYKESSASSTNASQSTDEQPATTETVGDEARSPNAEIAKIHQAVKAYAALDPICLAHKATAASPRYRGDSSSERILVDTPSVQSLQKTVTEMPANESPEVSESDTTGAFRNSSSEDFVHVPNAAHSQPLQRISTREYFDELIAAHTDNEISIKLLRIMQEEQVSPASSLGLKLLDLSKELRVVPLPEQLRAAKEDDSRSVVSLIAEDRKLAENKMNELATILKQITVKIGLDVQDPHEHKSREEITESSVEAVQRKDEKAELLEEEEDVGQISVGYEEPRQELEQEIKEVEAGPVTIKDENSDCATPKVSFSDLMSSSRQVIDSVNAIKSPYGAREPVPSPTLTAGPQRLLERLQQRSKALADYFNDAADSAADTNGRQHETPETSRHHPTAAAESIASQQGAEPTIQPMNSSFARTQQVDYPYKSSVKPASPFNDPKADPMRLPNVPNCHTGLYYPTDVWARMSRGYPPIYTGYRQANDHNMYAESPHPLEGFLHPHYINQTHQRMMRTPDQPNTSQQNMSQQNMFNHFWPSTSNQSGPTSYTPSGAYACGPTHPHGAYPTPPYQAAWRQQLPALSPGQQRPF